MPCRGTSGHNHHHIVQTILVPANKSVAEMYFQQVKLQIHQCYNDSYKFLREACFYSKLKQQYLRYMA